MRVHRLFFVLVAALFVLTRPTLGQTIGCSSDDGGKKYCEADTRHGARLVKQRSDSPCRQDDSWGFDEEGIWVDHGCRGDFALGTEPPPEGDDRVIACSSDDGHKKYCNVDTRHGVRLVKQRSDSPCRQDDSWGFDVQGIWVDHGCRADFALGGLSHPDAPSSGGEGTSTTVSCSSDDGRKNYCDVDAPKQAFVRLIKQRSGAPCDEGSTWGYDGRSIWVDRGCRGDFLVQSGPRRGEPEAEGKPCARSLGERQAKQLVQHCLQVSPGTHPPCNAQNSCKLITDEIKRSCELLGRDAPGFCGEYR